MILNTFYRGACFWMNGQNTWKGYGKGDPNSIMTWHYDVNACSYDDAHITVTCKLRRSYQTLLLSFYQFLS